jgi:hypothetical protein
MAPLPSWLAGLTQSPTAERAFASVGCPGCLAWNDGIELAASPEDGRSPMGKNLIAGLSVIDDEAC